MSSPTASPTYTARPVQAGRNCSTSTATTTGRAGESALRLLSGTARLPPLAGRLAETGAAVRVVAGRYVAPPKLRPAYEPRPRAPSSRDRATVWLRGYLAQRGPVISTEVIADAAAAGISLSTLRKARIDVNVRLQRVPGVGARHTWQ